MSKKDLRNTKTRATIEREFFSCLRTMPFQKITVSLLAKRCQINRTTFYRNYEDVYDLADKIVEKYAGLIQNLLLENASILDFSNTSQQNMSMNVKQFAAICKGNQDTMILMWNSELPTNLFHRMTDIISTYMFSSICRTYRIDKSNENRAYLYANLFAAHAMTVLRWWLTDCPNLSIEEVSVIINRNAEKGFLYSVTEEFREKVSTSF